MSSGGYGGVMVTIAKRFNGPPNSGNGGYVSGLIAEALRHDGPVQTTLNTPPPLETPLSWERDLDTLRLVTHGGAVVGQAQPGSFDRQPPRFTTDTEVEKGRAAYRGFVSHPFDTCFTCGTRRAEGDGLRIFSGPVEPGLTAAPWDAHESLADDDGIGVPIAWAALDCPGGWAADFSMRPMLLGTMTAEVSAVPRPGRRYHATGAFHHRHGRKFSTGTALYTADGDLIGRAEQVWIQIDL